MYALCLDSLAAPAGSRAVKSASAAKEKEVLSASNVIIQKNAVYKIVMGMAEEVTSWERAGGVKFPALRDHLLSECALAESALAKDPTLLPEAHRKAFRKLCKDRNTLTTAGHEATIEWAKQLFIIVQLMLDAALGKL